MAQKSMAPLGTQISYALKARGVDVVFGIPGVHNQELYRGLKEAGLRHILARHEQGAGFMADGYARASGGAGVVLAGQNGPGATNLVTGLAQAKAAYSPVISIAGALSTAHQYRDAFQEVDQQALFAPITKKTWTVPSADRVPEIFREAFRTALAPRRGPVRRRLATERSSDAGDRHARREGPSGAGRPSRPRRLGRPRDAAARSTRVGPGCRVSERRFVLINRRNEPRSARSPQPSPPRSGHRPEFPFHPRAAEVRWPAVA